MTYEEIKSEIANTPIETPTQSDLTRNSKAEIKFKFEKDQNFIENLQSLEKSKKLKAFVKEVKDISPSDREKMWELYSNYYDGATWQSFNFDLDEKTHVIIAKDSGDQSLQGFSTIKRFKHTVDGVETIIIYSGDTIIHPDYWGQKALHLAFFVFVMKTRFANPLNRVFWFLLCNGYRTYLIFAKNIPNYWPRYNQETPAWEKNLIDSLATKRFGNTYNPEKGIVAFTNSLGLLKSNVAPIGAKELKDPAVKFLVEKNPGYIKGDELCCLGEITFSFMFQYPFKLIKKFISRLKR